MQTKTVPASQVKPGDVFVVDKAWALTAPVKRVTTGPTTGTLWIRYTEPGENWEARHYCYPNSTVEVLA